MFDLSKEPLEFKCPECGKNLKITLADAQSKKTIHCTGCGADIQLKPDKSVAKTLKDFNRIEKKLDDTFASFNKKMKL